MHYIGQTCTGRAWTHKCSQRKKMVKDWSVSTQKNEEINEGLVRFDLGSYEWKGNLDLLNIIMLWTGKKNLPEHDETYELHRLLGALLSKELTIDEKLNIIGNEYDIPIEENFRKDVSVM